MSEDIEKRGLSEEDRKKFQKFIVYFVAGLLFFFFMWLIYAPEKSDETTSESEFNTELPEASDGEMEGDKQSSYEMERVKNKSRQSGMRELSGSTIKDKKDVEIVYNAEAEKRESEDMLKRQILLDAERRRSAIISRSQQSTQKTLAESALKQEVEDLKNKLEKEKEKEQAKSSKDEDLEDQLKRMEMSYQVAAKYGIVDLPKTETPTTSSEEMNSPSRSVDDVAIVNNGVVSSLSQQRGATNVTSFNTAIGNQSAAVKNTISACIQGDQIIITGGAVRMRLLDPMIAGSQIIPRNSLITGISKIQGERLQIEIKSLEYNGVITPVKLSIVDTDGQEGIYVPNSAEVNALKEIGADLGSELGTTINLSQQSAGDQILTDLGKGAINGISNYIGDKAREKRVHLPDGYKIMIYLEEK